MLSNIESIINLRTLSRSKNRDYETKTISSLREEEYLKNGWNIDKRNLKSVRLKKTKTYSSLFLDRVWSLFYRMGFTHLSGDGGSDLIINTKEINSSQRHIDLVGIDDEVAVAVKCISFERRSSNFQFHEEIEEFSSLRSSFINAVRTQYSTSYKRQVALVIFISNIIVSEADRIKADQANVVILDDQDLQYYESLITHIGPAAKYQLCADMFPGKSVPGLAIRVPAIKTKMGGYNCYTFSIPPDYLLKISYISHRSKGKASDVNTYQRMVNKSRLSRIKQYISDNGIFPTNIVLNLDQKLGKVRFEKIRQESDSESGILGWLDIVPAYKSAWIIDGQHRLFAYSGHEKANTSYLSVIAFEGLLPSRQAQLFVDINAKQKSVKQSLLQELYAELHWDSSDPQIKVRAIISKAVQELGANPDSPLHQRIQVSDTNKDVIRCITLGSVFSTLEKTGFFILKTKNGSPLEYGPLWAGDNESTLKRTVYVISNWLNIIREGAKDWWDKGSGEGGGLAMNDGITTCLNVLRSVFQHLDSNGHRLVRLENEQLVETIKEYGVILGEYLGSFSDIERKRFRDLRGIQGQTTRTKRCQQAINERINAFQPHGLEEFIKTEKAQTNSKAKEIIDWIETSMQKFILDELRLEYGSSETEWWVQGVPKSVRTKASERYEQDDGKRGQKEFYFDLMDYRKIILDNWAIFESVFAFQKAGNKEVRTSWLNFVNDKRNIVSHPSSARTVSLEELGKLEEYKQWLSSKLDDSIYEGIELENITV
ncbi:DGQHR domain-containing protein [Brevibacillus halotolerans]|uniref:DGQHR domain-containing protein n=1 Tax=Brevibacillus laterosporus TaxID=1465 RepID=UPI00215CF2A5|nr:DGQHR domain-containing protein [Brevibacillus laterosporus]MCR8996191.1 DGQHR domain-containing protein [Brevibacillus laterosporus]WPS87802.1 DGQHR domain-containing protein [Brevibacillus halotolerans]